MRTKDVFPSPLTDPTESASMISLITRSAQRRRSPKSAVNCSESGYELTSQLDRIFYIIRRSRHRRDNIIRSNSILVPFQIDQKLILFLHVCDIRIREDLLVNAYSDRLMTVRRGLRRETDDGPRRRRVDVNVAEVGLLEGVARREDVWVGAEHGRRARPVGLHRECIVFELVDGFWGCCGSRAGGRGGLFHVMLVVVEAAPEEEDDDDEHDDGGREAGDEEKGEMQRWERRHFVRMCELSY